MDYKVNKEVPSSGWGLAALMSAGIAINYIDRANISHALVPIAAEFKLSAWQEGLLLSAFSWGYVMFMLAGGVLVDRWGPVLIAACAVVFWSAATAATAIAVSFPMLILSRLAVGVGEAPIFPANAHLVRSQFPLHARGRATAIFDAGSYVGTALSAPLVVYVTVRYGWRPAFVCCAALGWVWVVFWLAWSRRWRIDDHTGPTRPTFAAGWTVALALSAHRKVIGASLGFFCYNYAKSFYLTWFPAYLIRERGLTLLSMGYVAMLPPLAAVCGGLVAGLMTDVLIGRGISVTMARKLPLCIGLLLGSAVVITSIIESGPVAVGIICLAFAGTIAASPSIWAIPGDIAPGPQFVGTLGGIQNTVSNLAGIVAPIMTGCLVATTGTFFWALAVTAVLSVVGAASYWFVVGELKPIRMRDGGKL